MKKIPTVAFVGALPPPLGGHSKINEQIRNLLDSRCRLITINLSSGRLDRSLLYHVHRICRVLKGAATTILNAGVDRRLYVSADSDLGLVYNALFIALGRLMGYGIFIHHHSFSYIDSRSRLMALSVAMSGRHATHIFLCELMRQRFISRYPVSGRSLICSNARFVASRSAMAKTFGKDDPVFHLGLLSHLSAEKGLYDFVALLKRAKELHLPVKGILAGPPVSAADEAAIMAAQSELGDCLDFRGPLYGGVKEAFYRDIDAFVFPTHYRVESYALVVVEALSYGAPVISYARGCIEAYLEPPAGILIDRHVEFVESALPHIQHWLSDPASYAASSAAAVRLSATLSACADDDFDYFLSALSS
jgi:glycosyltransferase involved in cell wall biosynthesis